MSLEVHAFADEAAAAERLAKALGAPSRRIELRRFFDGEIVPIAPVSEAKTVVVYHSLHQPAERLLRLLLVADAYRRMGIERLLLVAPYFCSLRQDMVFAPGEPLSRDVIGPLIGACFDRVVTVQAHLHRTAYLPGVIGKPATNIDIGPQLAALANLEAPPIVVGPDVESEAWIASAARAVGGEGLVLRKAHRPDGGLDMSLPDPARVSGRDCLILDDICSSGGTLILAAKRLYEAGARKVEAAVAHAFFDADMASRMAEAGIERVISSDSVPHPTNELILAPLLAAALIEEMTR